MERIPLNAKPGEQYRIKHTPTLRACGVMVWRGAANDWLAWPGEIGTVVERTWGGEYPWGEKWTCSGLWLELSRGRQLCVTQTDRDEWIKVKKPKEAADGQEK